MPHILWLEDVDSTMEEARRRADGALPLWIAARHQHAGRGTRGRAWVDSPLNLKATLLLQPSRPMAEWSQLSLVVALALQKTLQGFLGDGPRLALKWPNDVLIDGRKLAGILLEMMPSRHGACLAIGTGVNLAAHPPPSALRPGGWPVTDLRAATGLGIAPEVFLEALSNQIEHHLAIWQQSGLAPLRPHWMQSAYGLGEAVVARVGETSVPGRFLGIDDDGHLTLQTETGIKSFASAELVWNNSTSSNLQTG